MREHTTHTDDSLVIEYELGMTLSRDFNNIKPRLKVRVPFCLDQQSKLSIEAQMKLATERVKDFVDSVVHETIDQEVEHLMRQDPIYSTGPFYTLLHFKNPETFYIVLDEYGEPLPPAWNKFTVHGCMHVRKEVLLHRAYTRFSTKDAQWLEHLAAIHANELPEMSYITYVTLPGYVMAFPGKKIPTEEPYTALIPALVSQAKPTTISGPKGYLESHLVTTVAEEFNAQVILLETLDCYKEIPAELFNLKQEDMPHRKVVYEQHPDDDDDGIPF